MPHWVREVLAALLLATGVTLAIGGVIAWGYPGGYILTGLILATVGAVALVSLAQLKPERIPPEPQVNLTDERGA